MSLNSCLLLAQYALIKCSTTPPPGFPANHSLFFSHSPNTTKTHSGPFAGPPFHTTLPMFLFSYCSFILPKKVKNCQNILSGFCFRTPNTVTLFLSHPLPPVPVTDAVHLALEQQSSSLFPKMPKRATGIWSALNKVTPQDLTPDRYDLTQHGHSTQVSKW